MFKLHKSKYELVLPLLNLVPFNKLFAEVVIYKEAEGNVFVNDTRDPSVCLIIHKYGMALLCGDIENFNDELSEFLLKSEAKWLLIYPESWQAVIPFPKIERVNFSFQYKKNSDLTLPKGFRLQQIDKQLFELIKGSVVPESFWSKKIFLEKGIGYALLDGNQIVSSCFTSFIIRDKYELGVETSEQYRQSGYSFFPASHMINYCVENGFEPVWSCRKDNVGSYRLAQKLGFTPVSCHPYFVL